MSENVKYSCHKLISKTIWTHLKYINKPKSKHNTNNAHSTYSTYSTTMENILYCIHIRTRGGIYSQIYPFAWRSSQRRVLYQCPISHTRPGWEHWVQYYQCSQQGLVWAAWFGYILSDTDITPQPVFSINHSVAMSS